MIDEFESLITSAVADAAVAKLAKRHRWLRVVAFGLRVLFWVAIAAVVVVTFAYY